MTGIRVDKARNIPKSLLLYEITYPFYYSINLRIMFKICQTSIVNLSAHTYYNPCLVLKRIQISRWISASTNISKSLRRRLGSCGSTTDHCNISGVSVVVRALASRASDLGSNPDASECVFNVKKLR